MSTFYDVLADAMADAADVLELDLSDTDIDAVVLRVGEWVLRWLDQGFNGSEP